MKIGIIEAGAPPTVLAGRFGSYGNMFRRLLGPAFSFEIFDVRDGALPAADNDCEAYLISGSSSGVYDGDPWISEAEGFIRDSAGSKPMIGVCFGHQLMAQALGGRVIKSPKGWGLGLHRYNLLAKAPWMDGVAPIALPASHQDQVVEIGPQARVLAGSDFTPFAMLAYPELRAMSLQPHPEFEPDYTRALIETRRGANFDEAMADEAVASLQEPNDRLRVTVWLRRFLNTA
jgi:GMP synthase-like glutamine amidotransferase